MIKGELQLPAAPARTQLPGRGSLASPSPSSPSPHGQADLSVLASPSSSWRWSLAAEFLPCKEGLRTQIRGRSGSRKREVEVHAQAAHERHVRWVGPLDPAQIERSMAALAAAAARWCSEPKVREPLCRAAVGSPRLRSMCPLPLGARPGPPGSERGARGGLRLATSLAAGSPDFGRGGLTSVPTSTPI